MARLQKKRIWLGEEPTEFEIVRRRGDTVSERFELFDPIANTVVDITDYTFSLAVDPSIQPANADNNIYALTGTIEDAEAGIFYFPLSTADATATPGTYFFDLQATFDEEDGETGVIRTLAKGRWIIRQDITK